MNRSSTGFSVAAVCFVASLSAPLGADQTTEQAEYEQRQAYGHYAVVEADALVKDFLAGRITEAAFTAQVWEDYSVLSASYYVQWGSVTSPCFLKDLVFGQTNGVIGQDALGNALFFDTAQYLDSSGEVLAGMRRDYNTATRANAILRELLVAWQADPICQAAPPANNKCCDHAALEKCDPATGKRCDMDAQGLACTHGSTGC